MFTTLMESRAPKVRRVGGTLLSMTLHGALIAGAVALTVPREGDARPKPKVDILIYEPVAPTAEETGVRPPERSKTGAPLFPTAPQRVPVDVNVPHTSIDIDAGPAIPDGEITIGHGGVETSVPIGRGGSGLSGGGAWDANQVDRAPSVAGQAAEPRYPAQLRTAGVEGRAVLQFVVDTLGRAELGDVAVVETTHALFAESAREALPRFRFTPGEAAGRRVRTRVQIPFNFTITNR